MNSKLLVICLGFLLVVAFAEAKKGKGKGKGKGMMKCLGEDIKFDDESKKAWKECREEKKAKASDEDNDDEDKDKDDKKKKWMGKKACMTDCIYRKMDYITSDGKLDSDKIEAGIKSAYPEAVQDKIIADEKKCAELVTETLSTDDNCKSIKEYAKCHMKAVFSNCKSKDSKKKGKKDKAEKEE